MGFLDFARWIPPNIFGVMPPTYQYILLYFYCKVLVLALCRCCSARPGNITARGHRLFVGCILFPSGQRQPRNFVGIPEAASSLRIQFKSDSGTAATKDKTNSSF